MAAPCAFWARGNCKNGDKCRFEHIGPPGGGGGGGRGGGGYESRGGSSRGGQRGGRGDHHEPRPPAQHYPDNYREPQSYGGRGRGGGYQGGYQGGRQDDRSAYQGQSQSERRGYQGSQPRDGYQNDYEPRGGRGGRGRGGRGGHNDRAPPPTPANGMNKYLFSSETLYADLTSEIPGWILSSYSPGTKTPVQLFGGEDREKSFEEMRLNHYMLREQGQEAWAAQQQDELMQKAMAQNENARNNVEAAVDYVLQGENEHPNRNDIAQQYTAGLIDVSQPPPPEIQAIIHGALPSAVIPQNDTQQLQNVDAFGRPVSQQGQTSYGAPAAPAAFQQPSPFGGQPMQQQNSNPLAPPPFGQAQQQQNQLGGAFGQPAQQPSPFGQPQPPQQSPFGGFARPAQSAFGQPQQQPKGAFGSPAIDPGQNPLAPFNQSQPQQSQASNPFNNISMTSTTPLPTPPTSFHPQQVQQAQQPPTAFGHLQNPPTPQSSPFIQQQAQQQVQQQAQQAQQKQAQPQPQPQQQTQQNGDQRDFSEYGTNASEAARYAALAAAQPFGTGYSPIVGTFINVLTHEPFPGPWADPSPYKPGSQVQHPHVSLYSTRDERGRLLTWKNLPVEYRDENGGVVGRDDDPRKAVIPGMRHQDGRWERIWFPNGPPAWNKDTQVDEGEYTEEDAKAYAVLEKTGRFPNDKMPMNPPRREWTHWCF